MYTPSPSQIDFDLLCNEILSVIEIRESHLLGWGFMDVRSDLRADLASLLDTLPEHAREAWGTAKALGASVDAVLTNLCERKLLFESRGAYRTRFAETIRLLYLLRQRFTGDDWQTASRLVSDLRLQLQRRRYPRRDVAASQLLEYLRGAKVPAQILEPLAQLLQTGNGGTITLARFQHEAIARILQHLQEPGDHALAIGAGTGAGKTKAFYVPAFAAIATRSAESHGVQALALYPRIELLKDQLAEAYTEARKLDELLEKQGKRHLALGAYYGDVPTSARQFFTEYPPENWRRTAERNGWICPFFTCPDPACEGHDLVWSQGDLHKEVKANGSGKYGAYARLRCPRCGGIVGGEHLMLTRDHMVTTPPDLLFTTTEMLNRRLSHADEHALFGLGVPNPPRLVLLDEIHTYEGLTGAQVAYVLRRWRHARRRQPGHGLCLVGLSATLTDAESFLSKLTGLPPYQVSYIAPREGDLVEEGLEYNVVLKGDPVSGTSLLSTSVQAVMLLERMLDPAVSADGHAQGSGSVSRGALGQRTFAFTDNLDVINRWYHVEQDAETKKVLSKLRKRDPALPPEEQRRRNLAGQDWSVSAEIGHDLEAPLRLGLTSSQNPGVRSDAEVIVATSTLEVGFNDPTVGAVVQHKAPRSMASFLQRKGRAGRRREMRPWMVVVASAYGRDRWAFQHAENLFMPVLPPLELPIDNAYVQKIQATFACIDWLSSALKKQHCSADVRSVLSGKRRFDRQYQWARKLIAKLAQEVLDGSRLEELQTYLQGALDIAEVDRDRVISQVLWNEPRSLLFSVLPTLLRQAESDWQAIENGEPQPWSDLASDNPLPEFLPPNLFTDLNVPELLLHIPELQQTRQASTFTAAWRPRTAPKDERSASSTNGGPARPDELVGLRQGMSEFAPGRVSKRYASRHHTNEAHWLALPRGESLSAGQLPLEQLGITWSETLGLVELDGVVYRAVRPQAYTLSHIPPGVRDTSNAWLGWGSQFHPADQRENEQPQPGVLTQITAADGTLGNYIPIPSDLPSTKLIRGVTSYTQASGTWVDVTRLAKGVHVETRYTNGTETRQAFAFSLADEPAALGFTMQVDGLVFEPIPFDPRRVRESTSWPSLYRNLGPRYFLYRLRTDSRLAALSSFEIDWLWQLTLSMAIATAVARGCSLAEAGQELRQGRVRIAERTMKVIFQTQEVEDEEDERVGRLHSKLLESVGSPAIQAALDEHLSVLWRPDDAGLDAWLSDCYLHSLGAALFTAVTQLVPDIDPDDLIFDVEAGRLWITESTPGGIGLVLRIADAIVRHPRDLDLQLQDTLRTCEREQLAGQLHTIAAQIEGGDAALSEAFAAVRAGGDLPQHLKMRERLARVLEANGMAATRELLVALTTKFLRPNSSSDSDRLIATLVRSWDDAEVRLSTAIDLRVMAVAALRIPEIAKLVDEVLGRVGGPALQAEESQKFNLLQSLLWLSCADSCPDCIERRQPYQEQLAHPSRALLLTLLDIDEHRVAYGADGWEQRVRDSLANAFRAQISCEQEESATCKQTLLELITEPVEVGYQMLFPVVERITRSGQQWHIDLVIAELVG